MDRITKSEVISLAMWQDGTKAKNVREIIEGALTSLREEILKISKNLTKVNNNITNTQKSIEVTNEKLLKVCYFVTTNERSTLEYLMIEDTIVYDLDEEKWYKRNESGWIETNIGNGQNDAQDSLSWCCEFHYTAWRNGTLTFSYLDMGILDPVVQVFMKNLEGMYEPVIGGFQIDGKSIILNSDIAYDGKVVIK